MVQLETKGINSLESLGVADDRPYIIRWVEQWELGPTASSFTESKT
jgi:hypothetical protein